MTAPMHEPFSREGRTYQRGRGYYTPEEFSALTSRGLQRVAARQRAVHENAILYAMTRLKLREQRATATSIQAEYALIPLPRGREHLASQRSIVTHLQGLTAQGKITRVHEERGRHGRGYLYELAPGTPNTWGVTA